MCIPLCSQAMSVKEVKPVKFCPLSLSYIVRLFRFCYLRRFCHLIFTDSFSVDGFDLFCFCLDRPVGLERSFGLRVC